MSNVFKSIAKVFKKIVKSPIFKAVLISAAIYFTGGLAAGALGSTFAATLPGIAGAAEALGISGVGAFGATAVETAAMASAGLTFGGVLASEGATAIVAGDAYLPGLAATATESGIGAGAAAGVGADVLAPTEPGYTPTQLAAHEANLDLANGGQGVVSGSPVGNQNIGQSVLNTAAQPTQNANTIFQKVNAGAKWLLQDDSLTRRMIAGGLIEGGKALIGAYGQKQQMDAEQRRYDQSRADVVRRGQVPDLTGSWGPTFHTPGIINTGQIGG